MNNKDIIEHLVRENGIEYNLSKASEEFQELALILTQRLNKPTKINDQAIIDEIGDAIIRLRILKKMYPIDKIKKRVNEKLSKFETYIDHKSYKQI